MFLPYRFKLFCFAAFLASWNSSALCMNCDVAVRRSGNLVEVLPSYNEGVGNFNFILKTLEEGTNEPSGLFFQKIFGYAKKSYESFTTCASLVSQKSRAINRAETCTLAELNKKRSDLHQTETRITAQNRRLAAATESLSEERRRLREASATLSRLEGAYQRAEDKVENAKKCWKRKKRGIFDKIGNFFKKDVGNFVKKDVGGFFEHTVGKGVVNAGKEIGRGLNTACGVVHKITGARDDARRARNQARGARNNQQRRVSTANNNVQAAKNRLNKLTREKEELSRKIVVLNASITQYRTKHRQLLFIKGKVQKLGTHVSQLKAPLGPSMSTIKASQALAVYDKIESIIHLGSVTNQLQHIAAELNSNTAVAKFTRLSGNLLDEINERLASFNRKTERFMESHGDVEFASWDAHDA